MQTQDHDVEVVRVIPQERIAERIKEQIVDVLGPEIMDEIVGVVKFVSQEREKQHVVEQVVDVLARQIMVETIGVMKVARLERVCEKIEEQVDVPVPQVVEQIVDVLIRQIRKEIGEVIWLIPQVDISEFIDEKIIVSSQTDTGRGLAVTQTCGHLNKECVVSLEHGSVEPLRIWSTRPTKWSRSLTPSPR